jgi:hypothetical protein
MKSEVVGWLGWCFFALPAQGIAAQDDLSKAVTTVFEARCVRCHNESTKKGGLSLVSEKALREGGQGGQAFEPFKPDDSLLIEKITGEKPEMPKGGKPLSPDEVTTLRRWIELGAKWPKGLTLKDPKATVGPWWAIQPLSKTEPPRVKNQGWVRTPVDAFVLQSLEAKGLSPRTEADRRTLIRRLSFDLHGLPPSPAEIREFDYDARADAYERLVDRLLASPRYGERWGRHWLDVVHYGDTHGYDKDKRRDHAWAYRDYVIRAFNDDIPYAQFVEEQLAGDVLFPGRPNATVATGFVVAGPWDFVGQVELREGTIEKEKTRLIDRDDMVMNAMSTFQSLTVHCARCHDHKFDPIPQRDYYRLQAVFAGVDRGDRPFQTREASERRAAWQRRRDAAADRLSELSRTAAAISNPELDQLSGAVKSLRQQLADTPKPVTGAPSPTNGYHSSIHSEKDAAAWVQIDLGASVPIDEIRIIPARPTDFPDTPGFGFPDNFRVALDDDPSLSKPVVIAEQARPTHQTQEDEPFVVRAVGRQARFVRISTSRLWKRTNDYVFALSEVEIFSRGRNIAREAAVSALDSIESGRWSKSALVDGFDSRELRPPQDDPLAARRVDLIYRLQLAGIEQERLLDSLVDPKLRAELDGARAEVAEFDARIKAAATSEMVYAVLPRDPRPVHVLRRGEVEQPGELVAPGALTCLSGLDPNFGVGTNDGARRAALAQWIANSRNVLTWRSIVNRVWLYHFGRGIVETPSDFGRNGAMPTHPELLDWLATELLAQGQSIKSLHRLIVTSSSYRQSSKDDESSARIDAENRFYWRMNRRRLDAESIRDSTLAVTGELDLKMGGPAYEPFRFKDDHSPIYDHESLDRINAPETRRRAVYRFIVRSVPDPFLDSLDCADPNANVPVRNTTLTAPQALALLNDPFMIRQSDAFARRVTSPDRDMSASIDAAFRLAFGRLPQAAERSALSAYAEEHGLANACRVLLNTNEFVFVD